jgi:O-antigen/teichoic acid export membrane protein
MRPEMDAAAVDAVSPTPPTRSLGKNISWTTLGNIIYAGCQWGIITALAKFGTPSMVGQFALALAVTAPIVQFLNFHLRSVQATDAKQEYLFVDYFTLRTVTTILAVMSCFGVAALGGHSRETVIVIMMVALTKGIDAFSDVYYGFFQQREHMDVISKALVMNGVLSLLLLSAGVVMTGNLIVGVLGYAIGSLFPLVSYVVPQGMHMLCGSGTFAGRSLFRWRTDVIWRLARTALPLGIVMLLISLNTNIPRYFIEAEVGSHGLGIFAALAYLIVAGGTVVSAIGQAVSPRLAQYYASGRTDQFRSMLMKLMAVGVAIGLLGALIATVAGRPLVTFVYTAEYAEYIDVLIVLALAAGIIFAASFAGYGMTATRSFGVQVPIFLVVVLVGALSSWILIPRMGLIGAGYVTCLTALVQLVGAYIVVRRAMLRNRSKEVAR